MNWKIIKLTDILSRDFAFCILQVLTLPDQKDYEIKHPNENGTVSTTIVERHLTPVGAGRTLYQITHYDGIGNVFTGAVWSYHKDNESTRGAIDNVILLCTDYKHDVKPKRKAE